MIYFILAIVTSFPFVFNNLYLIVHLQFLIKELLFIDATKQTRLVCTIEGPTASHRRAKAAAGSASFIILA